ncbi:MAG: sporulation transcriptional regulator SpoIIID, partial [Clostridia bacterium]
MEGLQVLDIIFRVEEEARYIINNKSTLRQTAKIFGVSKSTVHID